MKKFRFVYIFFLLSLIFLNAGFLRNNEVKKSSYGWPWAFYEDWENVKEGAGIGGYGYGSGAVLNNKELSFVNARIDFGIWFLIFLLILIVHLSYKKKYKGVEKSNINNE